MSFCACVHSFYSVHQNNLISIAANLIFCHSKATKTSTYLLGRRSTNPFVDTLCFSFVDSESTLGLTLSCTTELLFLALVLSDQANLHNT